ncbi:hypothetical protein FRC14_004815 [Serendipita sp. 396]|nr:hypothetical protein FRC14_004815 [Serendipita sp. 396]KAG8787571.1 hypothetical protein FRC15_008927 [Serendipita sp. 397]KAG8797875.1 hypothetical protein FRC16_008443 [Serendipita sp. 398]KAG8835448.1 hypothetical protein FRC18_000480 [Serendipita sp. 400]KAG8868402.1 hypothetical protein FRC20_003457 [Serendipita sp. 405]
MLFPNNLPIFVLIIALLTLQSSAAPCHSPTTISSISSPSPSGNDSTVNGTETGLSAAQVIAALPSIPTSCEGSSNSACRTPSQIAEFVNLSFKNFKFETVGEQAAIFALMAFESGSFKFDVNVAPGRPGQGTRNMMMFDFVLPYALEFNATAVHAIRPDLSATSTAADVPDSNERNQIRATVLGDELSFGSGAWFLREKCGEAVALGLQSETVDGWNRYMGPECVGAGSSDPARLALYQATLEAMKK